MKKRDFIILFLISLVFYGSVSLLQKTPGYMDASYYFATGSLIARGKFASEPFLWNYLSSPTGATAPMFSYWMPLAGILAALPMALLRKASFSIARLIFILLASFIPSICFRFATRFTKEKFIHWLAALLGLLGGYYLPYLTITETFVPFLLLGACYFSLCWKIDSSNGLKTKKYFLLLGFISGLMHLTRADGILWLAGGFLFCILVFSRKSQPIKNILSNAAGLLIGYLIVMSGWFIRNLVVFHSIFPTGNNLSLFMTEYNDLFLYPANQITWQRWLNSGWQSIVSVRLDAVFNNLGSCVGIIGEIVVFPFLVFGLWNLRKEKVIRFALLMFLVVFLTMSIVFPFAGDRGGFFHSASAFQVLFWAVAAYGFEKSIRWIASKRKWQVQKSIPLLGSTLVICVAVITALSFYLKMTGVGGLTSGWDKGYTDFQAMNQLIVKQTGDPDGLVMVNDSPGFYAATRRSAVQEINCDPTQLRIVLDNFQVKYLLIGKNHLPQYDSFYEFRQNQNGFTFLGQVGEDVVYAVAE